MNIDMNNKWIRRGLNLLRTKQGAESSFWKAEINAYKSWYNGEIQNLYDTECPKEEGKVSAPNVKDASILTWHKQHQEKKYLRMLDLEPTDFSNMKLLDIGSGPIPSATCFEGSDVFCLEPLLPDYLEAGFPIHYYKGVTFINAASETIPVEENFFDAVISVNAIDHVDDIRKTSSEIKRVLKNDGLFRMHVHYHPPTKCEPITYDDDLFTSLFDWCGNLKKIKSTPVGNGKDEQYVLWSNF